MKLTSKGLKEMLDKTFKQQENSTNFEVRKMKVKDKKESDKVFMVTYKIGSVVDISTITLNELVNELNAFYVRVTIAEKYSTPIIITIKMLASSFTDETIKEVETEVKSNK